MFRRRIKTLGCFLLALVFVLGGCAKREITTYGIYDCIVGSESASIVAISQYAAPVKDLYLPSYIEGRVVIAVGKKVQFFRICEFTLPFEVEKVVLPYGTIDFEIDLRCRQIVITSLLTYNSNNIRSPDGNKIPKLEDFVYPNETFNGIPYRYVGSVVPLARYSSLAVEGTYYYYIPANVSYHFNYENAPNNGYYSIDNLPGGSKVYQVQHPLREGYKFIGWYKDAECTIAWNMLIDTIPEDIYNEKGYVIFQEIILYAGWSKTAV